jgi:hypothetical protein
MTARIGPVALLHMDNGRFRRKFLVDACVPLQTLTVRLVGIGCAGEVVSVMSARGVISDRSGVPVRWHGGFAVVALPVASLTPPALAGEACAVLDAGATGLLADLPGVGACDSSSLDALMRAARRARGWGRGCGWSSGTWVRARWSG